MAMDLSGKTLAQLMAEAGLGPPALPSNPTQEQINAYNTAIAAQATAYSIILTYIHANATINVPAAGILDGYGQPCTGSGTGTIS
jgi:hypothetical protein